MDLVDIFMDAAFDALLQLCEAESISYLDEVAGSPKSMHLAKSVAIEFLEILRIAFRSEVRLPGDTQYKSNPMGLLLLNALRLADIFSDDSNFRSFFMSKSVRLCSLSRYAISLTPNFLIDEDVHLLSKYADELQNLTHPEVGDRFIQQSSLYWTKFPNSTFSGSQQGSEITSSQLKNWLNNRKARLARAAREARAPSEGETYPDKSCGPSSSHFCDSSESAGEEIYAAPARGSTHQSISKSGGMITRSARCEDVEMTADFIHGAHQNCPSIVSCSFEPGQFVSIVDVDGKLVGKGKIIQVEGRWHGMSLEDSGTCVVDVTELKIEKWKEVQHPSEAAGRTFEEASAKNGDIMRVAWDVSKIFALP
ncbi:hypothetical protein GW17_00005822 [Ensete ventricosum]|nr:hypothetical protein GW17_00005822 [Ensete ventricosum]RZR76196.1 hypothetical protein BHM03_00000828 [Ensete ventricosum]